MQVECIFDLVRDNKFFADLDGEMSLELCRHMTYTTLKQDRVVFYKGDPGAAFYSLFSNRGCVHLKASRVQPPTSTKYMCSGGTTGAPGVATDAAALVAVYSLGSVT